MTIDKSDWGPGSWNEEPDKLQYPDEDTGLPCLILRSTLGHLCGYVGVSSTHPLFGKSYEEPDIKVHGGLTFAGKWEEQGNDIWWFGFDCGHMGDRSPHMDKYICIGNGYYKTIKYVQAEVKDLARQLKELA